MNFELDQKLLYTLIVFVLVLAVLMFIWNKFMEPAKPAGALSQAEYDKLSAADQATYEKRTDGYYYKKA